MFKLIIPTLSVALLCNSIVNAQYFGTKYSASSSYKKPTGSIRIARATDQPQLLDAPAGLEPPALSDLPEQLELPIPVETDKAAVPEKSRNVQPEISANDFDSLEPITPLQSILEPSPAQTMPIPQSIDFNEAIRQQQLDFAQAAQQPTSSHGDTSDQFHGGTHSIGYPASNGGNYNAYAGACGSGQCTLPYRTPILPPPNTFHGHFRSNPCYFDLWANYPAEAAAACAHNRGKLAPTGRGGCSTCELVAPCPRR